MSLAHKKGFDTNVINLIWTFICRSNGQIKKADTIHAQDYGAMSVEQLNSNVVRNKKTDMKISEEMQYVHVQLIEAFFFQSN